jgi:hypothetical protein
MAARKNTKGRNNPSGDLSALFLSQGRNRSDYKPFTLTQRKMKPPTAKEVEAARGGLYMGSRSKKK